MQNSGIILEFNEEVNIRSVISIIKRYTDIDII